jgi:peptidoglycan/xylan/chitin deacetylase (PgdA/CDA1 family)
VCSPEIGRGAEPLEELRDSGQVARVWRDTRGGVVLPFDPNEAIEGLWSEAYASSASNRLVDMRKAALRAYYAARPLLPRQFQIWLRRRLVAVQGRRRFPRWPLEPALHDLYGRLFGWFRLVAEEPVPWIGAWPRGVDWTFVLTHDVETRVGYENINLLSDVEVDAGVRSSWNFVARRYDVAGDIVGDLAERGFEIGVHGLHHDGRDLAQLDERLPAMHEAAERWGAVGFRSPATHRDWELMWRLGFDYDSSYPDTDPYEPQPGGCCTWLPYFNRELVELPITLPQDHTLFVILRHTDESAWVEKTEQLRAVGGLALLVTHPDYMLDHNAVDIYRRYVERFAEDPKAWRALPREVSSWWRRRAATSLRRRDGSWELIGPGAAEATLRYDSPPEPA